MTPSFFVIFYLALAVLSLRSLVILRARAPWTSGGWGATFGYGVAAAVENGSPGLHQPAAIASYAFFIALTIAFVIAGVRDEPQAEPWWWPALIGLTRAERRR